ncbi:Predicted Zn-dependent protease, minimal metalloprotease (MMP)-like domain [Paracoccus isoporae]|uniref:Predicted Zn-dependent protease, minimal metalloprotease (MMP)-like domain n=2 Tax=Paracoccus isoporae TaxID=591205 RepID=A0A1G6SQZ4_9RHOB|nr:Predicted Zn-dependent protease, minimal metalloprotease (MMP)-like domain [Paracoccus isoporae]
MSDETQDWTGRVAPTQDDIESIARDVIATLPTAFAPHARDIVLRVEDLAPDDMLDELETDDPLELTGIYDGVPMTHKSPSDPQHFPDTIWLFRRAILDEWAERGDITLPDLVAHVTVHELAHHFGWSDDDIARIDRWWE